MLITSSSLIRTFLGLAVVASLGVGCTAKKKGSQVTGIAATVDANLSNGSVSVAAAVADGTAAVEVAVVLLNQLALPVPGVTPELTLDPATGVASISCTVTDEFGLSTCSVASTKAETKTVSLSYPIQKAVGSVDFTVGAKARLCFVTQPGGGTAGVAWATQPVIQVGDVRCNPVAGATDSVTLSLIEGTGGLSGTLTQAAVDGVATFTNVSMNTSGSDKRMRAAATGLTSADSNLFSIVGSTPASLAFATQPGGGASGAVWAQQPVLHLRDSFGNVSTSSNATVVLTIETGTGSLAGAFARNASAGVAAFSGLSINAMGSKSLRASAIVGSSTLTVVSSSFNVTVGAPAKLAFSTQPGGGTLGTVWAQQPVVQILDAQNNLVNTSTAAVTVSLQQGSGTLGGVLTVNAVGGVASFSGLSIDQAGADKILRASSGSLTAADSDVFTILAGGPTRLCFQTQPGNGNAGQNLFAQPTVFIGDSNCSLVTSAAGTISLAISSGTGSLNGTTVLATTGGVATFSGLSMTELGSKQMAAQYTGPLGVLSDAVSNTFTISPGSPNKLVFATQPSASATAGGAFATQPVVQIRDAWDNVTTSSASVTLSLGTSNTGSLLGTATVSAVSGVATFSGLSVDLVGTKQLVATSGTLTGVISNNIVVSHGSPSQLVFTTSPNGGSAAQVWTQQPVVELRDAFGNSATSATNTVSLSILAPGTGSILGSSSIAAVAGVASFSGLAIDYLGSKQIVASSAGLTSGTSGVFSITAGSKSHLCFIAQPAVGTAGVAFTTQPRVVVADAGCNPISSATDSVTLLVQTGTGTLIGSTTVAASSGTATFAGIQMNVSGAKVLRASSGTLTVADTSSFNVLHGAPTQLVFSTQPGNGSAMVALAQQPVVQVRDALGNVADSSSLSIGLTLSSGTGVLQGSGTLSASSGVATFSGLSFNLVGSKQLTASASGVSSAVSSSFTINPGAPSELVLLAQPGAGTAGVDFSTQPRVVVRDAGGNTVTGYASAVNLSVSSGSGTLVGSGSLVPTSGTASFTGLSMQASGTKALTASSGTLALATTASFVISPAAPSPSVTSVNLSKSMIFDTGSDTITVTGVIRDAFSNLISGKSVTLTSSRGASDTITTSPATSDASGVVTYTLSSTTVGSGSLTLAIPADGVTATIRPSFTVESYVPSAAMSSWSVSPVSRANDGVQVAVVNATIRNANGVALPGKSVTLSSSRGGTDTIATSPETSDTSGGVTYSVSSTTRGEAALTLAVPANSVNITTSAPATFLDVAPVGDWQARLANSSVNSMGPGVNSPTATSSWIDLTDLGPNDGALTNFGFTTTSGWCGTGSGTISTCASGPYRLVFDGTNDYAYFGTGLNSSANQSAEVWVRPNSPTTGGRVIASNGDSGNRGLTLRQAWDSTGRAELTAGTALSYPGVVQSLGPTAYYRMNETTGTVMTAVVGTTVGYASLGTIGVAGGLADGQTAVWFNGTNTYAGGTNIYPAVQDQSVVALVYVTSGAGQDSIAGKGSSTTGYFLELNNGVPRFRSRQASGTRTATASGSLNVNTWYHLAGVRDGTNGTLKIYVDGVESGSTTVNAAPSALTTGFFIGRSSSGTYFHGRIDEVAVFNKALTQAEITQMVNAVTVPTCYSTSALSSSSWNHLVGTFEDSSTDLKLYVNGNSTPVCTRASTGFTISGSATPWGVGAIVDSGNAGVAGTYFNGAIGDFRIYNQALSGSQVNGIHSATSPRFP